MRRGTCAFLLGSLSAALWLPAAARAETYEIRAGEDLIGRLRALSAGDEVIVHDGTFDTGGFLEVTWSGTAAMPIVIRAADGARPAIRGVSSQNVINIDGSHFTLRGFEITGGSHGLRLGTVSSATLEDLTIHGIGDVGISCNRPGTTCDRLVVRNNEIYDTGAGGGPGEGMYIGCNDAACVVSNSVFEGNYIHDIGGTQGDGIEIKTGSYGNVVRDNVIIGANYPAITLYGFAAGAGEPNLVERNFVWGTNDNGIQVVGQVVVRNNIVIDAGANGIHSKASQGFYPHDVVIVHNTVFNAGAACMKTNDWSGQSGQLIANNAFYCPGGLAVDINGGAPSATLAGNVALGEVRSAGGGFAGGTAASDLGAPASAPPVVYPPSGSPLIDAGDPAHGVAEDFNGTARSDGMPDVGAYEHTAATNPGWPLGMGFRTRPDPPPPGDGGSSELDAGSGGADASTRADAGRALDAGADRDGGAGTPAGGCGCRAGAAGADGALALLALLGLLAARRRRPTSPA